MKKTESLPSTSALFTCTCGAMPYDAEKRPKGKVGLTRYRKSSRYAKAAGRWSAPAAAGSASAAARRSMQKPDGMQSGTSMAR